MTLEVLLGRDPAGDHDARNFESAAAHDGRVFAASKRWIWAIDPRTARIDRLGPSFDGIEALAADGRGGLLISVRERNYVARLDLATGAIDRTVAVEHPGPIACVGDRVFVTSLPTRIFEIDRAFATATSYAGGGAGTSDGPVTSAGFRNIHSLAAHRGALYASDHHRLRHIDLATATVSSHGDYRLGELHALASDGTHLFGCRTELERLDPDGAVTTLGQRNIAALACSGGQLFGASGSQLTRFDAATGEPTDVGLLADYADNWASVAGMVALHGSQLALVTAPSPTLVVVDLATGAHDAVRVARASHTTAVAFDGGDRLYVCDWQAGVVCIAFGARTAAAIPGIRGADRPDAIAIGAPDQLLVSKWTDRQLVAIDLTAGTSSVLAELQTPVELAYDGRGALYVGGSNLVKIDLRTHERTIVAELPCAHLAAAADGHIYVAYESTLSRVSPSGAVTSGVVPIRHIGAMCCLPDGSLAVVDRDRGVVLRARLPA
ncbi:MAG TPA: hypothetical protein VH143_01480 [Kofleriaceae bacterium]|jgi:hypothetical protein|nr:hypothetical protein [Kofleriaceae bacterium]